MLIAIAGPSGSGKSTLAANLRRARLARPLLSYTTRPSRPSDVEGELACVTEECFERMHAIGIFLWHVRPYGSTYRYGTRQLHVHRALASGEHVAILTGEALPMLYGYAIGRSHSSQVKFLYLVVDDEDELRRRLAKDPTRTDVERRIASAPEEIRQARESSVPYHFIDSRLSKDEVLAQAMHFINA